MKKLILILTIIIILLSSSMSGLSEGVEEIKTLDQIISLDYESVGAFMIAIYKFIEFKIKVLTFTSYKCIIFI